MEGKIEPRIIIARRPMLRGLTMPPTRIRAEGP
jgi:hypothetical protein